MQTLIKLGASRLQVSPRLSEKDFEHLRDKLTYTVPNYIHTTAHKKFGWDGTKLLFHKNYTAPAGCVYRIEYVLKKLGHDVEIRFDKNYKATGDINIHGFELDKFQQISIKRAVKYRYCIIEAPVRAGKTAIIAGIIQKINHFPVWVLTNGKDLVIQTQKALAYHLQRPVGIFSESKFLPEDIIVSSYQAIGRAHNPAKKASIEIQRRNKQIRQSIQQTKVLLLDECHHAFAPKNSKCIEDFRMLGYKIGCSATPRSDLLSKLQMEAGIGAIVYKVKYTTLINTGRLAKPLVILYDLPYAWFTKRLSELSDIYVTNIVENPFRNRLIAEIVSKLRKQKKTSFIVVRRIIHGSILRELIPRSVFVHGKIDSSSRRQLYEALHNKSITCIIATVGKEGLNIPNLDAVINAEGYKSSLVTKQKMRSLTATDDKTHGLVIDFLDKGRFLRKHSKKRLNQYNRLDGFKVKVRNVPKNHYKMEHTRWL